MGSMISEDTVAAATSAAAADRPAPALPGYLEQTYHWAYLNPIAVWVFDRAWVVSAILWGNADRLIRAALAEVAPGNRVLQAACVYGPFSPRLAAAVGETGRLDVIDVAPIQAETCRRKLDGLEHTRVMLCDASTPPDGPYDRVVSFFLLHEVPETYKETIVTALLDRVGDGGRAVFVDYHRPHLWHPLRPVMWVVFRLLEPFAPALWRRAIRSYAEPGTAGRFSWTTETVFGGLFQKTVAIRTS